jgi:hypothetical protein
MESWNGGSCNAAQAGVACDTPSTITLNPRARPPSPPPPPVNTRTHTCINWVTSQHERLKLGIAFVRCCMCGSGMLGSRLTALHWHWLHSATASCSSRQCAGSGRGASSEAARV